VYRWDSDTPLGYGGVVPKTKLTVIEVYGAGVKLKDVTGTEIQLVIPHFTNTWVYRCWCPITASKRPSNDKAAAKVHSRPVMSTLSANLAKFGFEKTVKVESLEDIIAEMTEDDKAMG